MLLSSEVISTVQLQNSIHITKVLKRKPPQIELTNKRPTKQCNCLVEILMLWFWFTRLLFMTASFFFSSFFSNILQNSNYTWCGRFAQHIVSLILTCVRVSYTVYIVGVTACTFLSLTSMANFSCSTTQRETIQLIWLKKTSHVHNTFEMFQHPNPAKLWTVQFSCSLYLYIFVCSDCRGCWWWRGCFDVYYSINSVWIGPFIGYYAESSALVNYFQ